MRVSSKKVVDALNERFLASFPSEAAKALNQLPYKDAVKILEEQPYSVVVNLWSHLLPETADLYFSSLKPDLFNYLVTCWEPAYTAATLARLDTEARSRCLSTLPAREISELELLMSYPAGSAGEIMDTHVMRFNHDQTVGEALAQIKKRRLSIRTLMLVDQQGCLDSFVDIQSLALAPHKQLLGSLARPVQATVAPFDSREEVADKIKQHSLEVLPVVDINNKLLGIIRHDAILQTLQEDAASSLQSMVGVSKEERALSPAFFSVKKRLPWLQINLLTAFLAASVVGLFEQTIAQFTALAVLLPVVAGQSGNAGAQALAVTIRGLALREITLRHSSRILFKEVRVGLVNGLAVAFTTALGVYFWSGSLGLSAVITFAMVISMIAACASGAIVPITLSRLGQDPAQSSSIFLTTVTDIVGFFSFLGIATLMADYL